MTEYPSLPEDFTKEPKSLKQQVSDLKVKNKQYKAYINSLNNEISKLEERIKNNKVLGLIEKNSTELLAGSHKLDSESSLEEQINYLTQQTEFHRKIIAGLENTLSELMDEIRSASIQYTDISDTIFESKEGNDFKKEQAEALNRLENAGYQDTEIYKQLKEMSLCSDSRVGVILMAPTQSMYDYIRGIGDSVYNEFIKTEMNCNEFIVLKHPSKKEYLATILASPLVDSLTIVGHGNGDSIAVEGGGISQQELEYFYEKILIKDKTWKPLSLLLKKTCGAEEREENIFGAFVANNTRFYEGSSNPLSHILSKGQQMTMILTQAEELQTNKRERGEKIGLDLFSEE